MRRTDKLRPEAEAWEVISRAPVLHLAAVAPDGRPLLRALHGVVKDGAVWFHGSSSGEKAPALDGPAVITASRIIAEIPSHWTHPERACPATTFFRSAMMHGGVEPVLAPAQKAAALQDLMERYQPGGGYHPITADDPMYAASVRSVAIWRFVPERVCTKAALGQKKSREWKTRALEGLWASGQLSALRELSEVWEMTLWSAPSGARISVADPEHTRGAIALLRDLYWNTHSSDDAIRRAHKDVPWITAVDDTGRVVATARAIADGAKLAYVMDVAIADDWRGRGLGSAVMAVLLDHPQVRGCQRVELHTRDAGPFYERLGFTPTRDPAWRRAYRRLRQPG